MFANEESVNAVMMGSSGYVEFRNGTLESGIIPMLQLFLLSYTCPVATFFQFSKILDQIPSLGL